MVPQLLLNKYTFFAADSFANRNERKKTSQKFVSFQPFFGISTETQICHLGETVQHFPE